MNRLLLRAPLTVFEKPVPHKKNLNPTHNFYLITMTCASASAFGAMSQQNLFMRFFTHTLTRFIFHVFARVCVCGGMRNVRVRPRDFMHFYINQKRMRKATICPHDLPAYMCVSAPLKPAMQLRANALMVTSYYCSLLRSS